MAESTTITSYMDVKLDLRERKPEFAHLKVSLYLTEPMTNNCHCFFLLSVYYSIILRHSFVQLHDDWEEKMAINDSEKARKKHANNNNISRVYCVFGSVMLIVCFCKFPDVDQVFGENRGHQIFPEFCENFIFEAPERGVH
jgi:hypothetical protein